MANKLRAPYAEDSMEGDVSSNRKPMLPERQGITHKVEIYDETTGQTQEGYVMANTYPDGQLGEVFLQGFGKQGSTLEGWIQVSAILFSTAIQYGAEWKVLARKLAHTKFPPYGPTDNPEIPRCRSVPDYIMHWLVVRFGDNELRAEMAAIDKELEERA